MSKIETIHAYVESGDLVKCHNCNTNLLLPTNTDTCPKCSKEGYLVWIDEQTKNCDYDELIKRRYSIKSCRDLVTKQPISKEIIKK